jgi:putative acetyltransferase
VDFIVFRPFRANDAQAFRDLNEEWIREFFTIEPKDLEVLNDPETHILAPGGAIFMAEAGERTIGCCALVAMGDASFELAKMTITASHRGRGIGREFLRYVIAEARQLRAKRLYLESNRKLANAIRIYEAAGFRPVPQEQLVPSPYSRTDVFMELWLGEVQFREQTAE